MPFKKKPGGSSPDMPAEPYNKHAEKQMKANKKVDPKSGRIAPRVAK
jgi:hypothetical protein